MIGPSSDDLALIVPQRDDVDAQVLRLIDFQESLDVAHAAFDDFEFEHPVADAPSRRSGYVLHALTDHVEGHGYGHIGFVQIGHVVDERPLMAGVDETQPRRAPQ